MMFHYELLDAPVECPHCRRPARAWLFMSTRGLWRPEEHWDNVLRVWCVLPHEGDSWWHKAEMYILRAAARELLPSDAVTREDMDAMTRSLEETLGRLMAGR